MEIITKYSISAISVNKSGGKGGGGGLANIFDLVLISMCFQNMQCTRFNNHRLRETLTP